MGIITELFLYCLPYVVSVVVGYVLARAGNSRSLPEPSPSSPIGGTSGKQLNARENVRNSRRSNPGVDRDELEQGRIESCDGEDEVTSEELPPGGEEGDEGSFNLDEGAHIPYKRTYDYTEEEMVVRSRQFYEEMNNRRSVRFFSDKPVPLEVIENLVRTAGTGPSGGHTEPWVFSVVRDQELKIRIREIIEAEEKINYERRMGQKWVDDLRPMGVTHRKPYLTKCSTLIVVFRQVYSFDGNGERKTHYYNELSTAVSVGLMLAAVEKAGLVTCTTTPMNAGPSLRTLLGRESYERVTLLLPVGYPAEDAVVPDIYRKPLRDIIDIHDSDL